MTAGNSFAICKKSLGAVSHALLACSLAGAAATAALAHLEPGSLSSPKAGQAYAAGSRVNITWVQAEYHFGKYDLAYSKDDGSTWVGIAAWTGPSGDEVTVNYAWTVPDAPGAATRVRVCQIMNCQETEYFLISGPFTIAPASAVRPRAHARGDGPAMHASEGNLHVSFSLDRAGQVVLEARDARGVRKAALLEGRFAAGRHDLHLASPLLRGDRPLFLLLRVEGQPLAETLLP